MSSSRPGRVAAPAARVGDEELDACGARDPTPTPPLNDEAMNTPEKVEGLLAVVGAIGRRRGDDDGDA